MIDRSAVVIGAGPAGLAAAAELGRLGVHATVLEQSSALGASWRARYDRLRLNSSRWFSNLPGLRHERGEGPFPSRDQMVRYLEEYARSNALEIRVNTRECSMPPSPVTTSRARFMCSASGGSPASLNAA